ncbi:transglutaminase family protein [Aquabacter spiritensis]|uniref:Transglutaminase-like putative cysteine protease n=1 Tax=Aquabacter spiritensis TaxID=933073 RepID=A0A4R3LY33_9HYPH|nr:transglutaminase family protein [Aquabacter spiritensis]TCT04709.1 transglutaminase-like putative cysteine protease [Aquabacter spiritensis]
MRVRVRHELTFTLKPGLRTAIAAIRVTPRNHEGQYIQRWSLDIQPDCRLHLHEDAFGNLVHTFSVEAPGDTVVFAASGDADTQDTCGIVRRAAERFPPSLFLRPTDLTLADAPIVAMAEKVRAHADEPLGQLHALMSTIHETIAESDGTGGDPAAAASAVIADGKGPSGGLTHLFLSAARHLKIPARQISGYVAEAETAGALREWAEAYVPKIGWIGFDCGRALCPTEAYVRLAVGLDALGVCPVRGLGTAPAEVIEVREATRSARSVQSQTQRQR